MDSINRIFQVIEYMNHHINEELSLDDFCNVSGYTKSYLSYLFKFYIGETPNKYFYKLKLKRGANLLFGKGNVVEIAIDTGFGSHEAFSRAFKKEFGTTPTEYRTLYINGLSNLNLLNDIELILIFSASPAYRLFLGMYKYGKYYNTYQSLINKRFINEHNLDWTIEGKQLSDKYYWDCSKTIIKLAKTINTLKELYINTNIIIHIPQFLFYKFVHGLVEIRKLENVFLGRCGCDCFKCDTLKATINDDDALRRKQADYLRARHNITVDYAQINCFGCTSDNRSESCVSHCPWTPCCQTHTVLRCNQCSQYPCSDLSDLFMHLPEFKENFGIINDYKMR